MAPGYTLVLLRSQAADAGSCRGIDFVFDSPILPRPFR